MGAIGPSPSGGRCRARPSSIRSRPRPRDPGGHVHRRIDHRDAPGELTSVSAILTFSARRAAFSAMISMIDCVGSISGSRLLLEVASGNLDVAFVAVEHRLGPRHDASMSVTASPFADRPPPMASA
jgi:hypothetical protein